jgi:hypothetical protein
VPESWGGKAHEQSGMAWLCGVCADNLYLLQQMWHAADGRLPWEVRREFGNDLRALVSRGWVVYEECR